MKNIHILGLAAVIVLVVAAYYALMAPASTEQACVASGGTVSTSLCCLSASDFPNTCTIGACGCSAENSHEVSVCDCGEGRCWNGDSCAAMN